MEPSSVVLNLPGDPQIKSFPVDEQISCSNYKFAEYGLALLVLAGESNLLTSGSL